MAIVTENLIKTYRSRRVVNGVSITVNRGQIVGLLGPNGAGKTTTFYMVVGLVKPNGGEVLLDGEKIGHLPMHLRARKGIGYLAQEPSVFRKLTVEENIIAVWQIKGVPKAEQRERLPHLLEEFNLTKVARNKGSQLSGGERRRVEIARAMAANPSFLLLDEPFSAIDPLTVAELQKMIRRLKEKNLGILITDHNVRETLGVVDYAHILSNGEVVVSGTPEQIAASEIARKHYLGEEFRM
ncbi:MAG: LPS export ABC transporter ATP-binding protein [Candidatus Sericytochromatia bacterium]|nr:LPS export ABC transporter ATP-binding protein [Candidatus Sericytochromatia bacterium]